MAFLPNIRRGRRHINRHTNGSAHAAASQRSSTTRRSVSTSITFPPPIPCYNYYELLSDKAVAIGNVEIADAEEAYRWQLVGRRVSEAQAEKEGGCVKLMEKGSSSPKYYCIKHSDDEVYGRASYLPRLATSASLMK
ncbi:hypothetical protein ABL78_2833 [Leptomonas seymouri]|uniref:Uncharacterized protein n=1 Tax=Leptomonas seymouri TaxID=5684 RepID=A0A0N0P793_LEPSE|nr:hypothetical protein ABL78_2833 [Leptomonas seymouri]|eukprot:KPI88057.1 hypothetical protein ABL78_2833 [Leptomonas seymouri]